MDPGDGTHNNHSTQQGPPLTSSHSVKDVIVLKLLSKGINPSLTNLLLISLRLL